MTLTTRSIKHSLPTLGEEEILAVTDVLKHNQIAPGVKCKIFETQFSTFIGKKYAVSVNSGMAALHTALTSFDLNKEDEIIIPSLVCEALLFSVLHSGARPVIVDVDESGNISPKSIENCLTKRTKGIIVPHLFGLIADMEQILSFDIPVIEDCAMSLGAVQNGRKSGNFSEISVFSFYATKMIATGQGGMILTDNPDWADSMRNFRSYKNKNSRAFNYEMDDISATLGIEQLKKLDYFVKRRMEISKIYTDSLKGICKLPHSGFSSFYRYVIRVDSEKRDLIKRKLLEQGIECGFGVSRTLHTVFPEFSPYDCPVSSELCSRFISLPIYPSLSDNDVHYIIENLIEIIKTT